jgi:hypothetical protein
MRALDYAHRLPITQAEQAFWQEPVPMFDYRLFYPQASIDDQARVRRPHQGHPAQRVYQLPVERRFGRHLGRR